MARAVLRERVEPRRDGEQLRWLEGGTGDPLVLCHGFIGSAENFAQWFDRLSESRTLVIPDLPGFGSSAPLAGPHTSGALAEVVCDLIDRLELRRFDLGGLCLGVPVALEVARRRPESTGRILLHTPLLAPALVRRRFHLQVALMTAAPVFPSIRWLSRQRLVSDLYKRLIVEGDKIDAHEAQVNFENQCRASPRASREWLRDGLAHDGRAVIERHPGPTLILAAADDRIVDLPRVRELARRCPQIELGVIDDAGHGWTPESVGRQLELITAFLEGRASPRTAMREPSVTP